MNSYKSLQKVLLSIVLLTFVLAPLFSQSVYFEQSNRSRDLVQSNEESMVSFTGNFLHGVASGDPTPNSLIIWTRITPDNYGADIDVDYTVWEGPEANTPLVTSGTVSASADTDYTVKLDITGLDASKYYYYIFDVDGVQSVMGRGKTAGLPTDQDQHLRFGVVSCSNYQGGYFNAYRKLAERADLDAGY